jgi:type IV pilus assembly protein PilY1
MEILNLLIIIRKHTLEPSIITKPLNLHNQNRRNILYAGSNSGLLHAFSAETGNEEWAFLPPFLVGKLPTLINANLDGKVDGFQGGSNAIFGVDGSPIVHDVFMKGPNP